MTPVLNVKLSVECDDQNLDQSFSYLSKVCDTDASASFTTQLKDSIITRTLTSQISNAHFGAKFKGVMIEIGAARGSSAEKLRFDVFCSATENKALIDEACATKCHFEIGSATSIGIARISFRLGLYWLSFDAHIIDTNTLIIMSIDDMHRLGIHLNNLENALIQPETGLKVGVQRVDGHPFLQWNPLLSCFLTITELRRLHRRFGHPSIEKLMKVLARAGSKKINAKTRKILTEIDLTCVPCLT